MKRLYKTHSPMHKKVTTCQCCYA